MLGFLICVLVLAIALLLGYAYLLSKQNTEPVHERMEKYTSFTVEEERSEESFVQSLLQSALLAQLSRWCGEALSRMPQKELLDLRLAQAGLALRGSEFIVLTAGSALAVGLLVFIITRGGWHWALLSCLLLGGGAWVWVQEKIRRRRQNFNDQLGEAAMMMANALRSGMSFVQTLELVSQEMGAPIATEFSRVVRELRFGVAIEEALQHLRQRMVSYDLDLFVTAVLIQREVGGNLAIIMDHISENVRDRLLVNREMNALTAQGRLSGLVVGALPLILVVGLSVISPGYYDVLFKDSMGYWCLGIAAVEYLLGILMIKKLSKVEF